MDREKVKQLLEAVAAGALAPEQALARLRDMPVDDLRFARVDLHRSLRHGVPEAVFCQGKTPAQVVAIVRRLAEAHDNILATRADAAVIAALEASGLPVEVHAEARVVVVKPRRQEGLGLIVVVSAGTSDMPVAEEAAVTAETMGNRVERVFDCGVAGLHRLVPHLDRLNEANAIIAVAGMEGALPSVVGGLVDRPVIAVPTSIGYGASFGGVTALLAMLNSCAPGVSVVNIDNGYGAAAQANQINKLASKIR
ncbi:MAG TPA: nickel pincer cofactor biosynthesis protein LarB [Candidatus Eisenbacteria bacterium]|nr:nickel pincer cofactor biosynthesis protein LarB [Candidatus Eisenbacteria bacterium]